MNYVKDVCTKVLGLDWEDNRSSKFTIYIIGENPIKYCYIDDYGFLNDNIRSLNISLTSIVNGVVTFEKEPKFIPFYACPVSEYYYYVDKDGDGNLHMIHTCNDRTVFDLMCKKTHNMFKTRDLPSEQMEDVIKSLKGE